MRGKITAMIGVATLVVGVMAMSTPGRAYYGDPRFYTGQAPSQLLHNVAPDEFVLSDYGGNGTQQLQVAIAVGAWNTALQGTPNGISKFPLHFNRHNDPAANVNIKVRFVDQATINAACPRAWQPKACNDRQSPITTIYVLNDLINLPAAELALTIKHELGHSLGYDDQYNAGTGTCHRDGSGVPQPDSVMNCASGITGLDLSDFQYRYEPTYQSANPTFVDTWRATWNAVYQAGDVAVVFPDSFVEWLYNWAQLTDTNGSQVSAGYTTMNTSSKTFIFGLGGRFCVNGKIYNEVGYAGTRPWSPRSQYSCIGAAQGQGAGFLLATSDRTDPSSSTLYLRLKNFSGSTRTIGIFAYPSLASIGCDYVAWGNGATRECNVPLTRGLYSALVWYAWDGSLYSYGYLDFE